MSIFILWGWTIHINSRTGFIVTATLGRHQMSHFADDAKRQGPAYRAFLAQILNSLINFVTKITNIVAKINNSVPK